MFFDFSNKEICSAYIQGISTLFAGTLAFIAGCLAYRAATRETRRQEQQDKSKRQAFREMMLLLVEDCIKNLHLISFSLFSETIKPELWKDHSLLKTEEIKDVYQVCGLLRKIRNDNASCSSGNLFEQNQSALLSEDIPSKQNDQELDDLRKTLDRLRKSLKEPYL
ncbi:MAG: hypothetical protein K2W94_06455 [Alphaproteobacteria bacterium]|nr:hypothetical protein [Alphaproteobacteria bacterium]